MPVNIWPPEKIALLQKLAWEGFSASRIAAEMTDIMGEPISRSAVVGKISRMYDKDRSVALAAASKRNEGAPQVKSKPLKRAPRTAVAQVVKLFQPVKTVPQALAGIKLLEGEPQPAPADDFYGAQLPPDKGFCKWVLGDPKQKIVYCNHAALELGQAAFGNYCAYHSALAYRPSVSAKNYIETAAGWDV